MNTPRLLRRVAASAAALFLSHPGCSAAPDGPSIGKLEHLDGFEPRAPDDGAIDAPGPVTMPVVSGRPVRRIAAFSTSGALALVDAATGDVLSAAAPLDPDAPSPAWRDLSWDGWRSRFVVLVSNEDGRSGAIQTVTLDDDGLGAPDHHAWFDGIARGLPVPDGLLLFQDAYGQRWKLLHADGSSSPSKIGPLAASAWVGLTADGPIVHALAHGPELGAEIERWASVVDGNVGPVLGYSLDVPAGTQPACARLVATPALGGDAAIVDVVDGVPTLRLLDGVVVGQHVWPSWTGPAIERLEAAVSLRGGRRVVALSSQPPMIVALDITADGVASGATWIGLPAQVAEETRFWSRDLLGFAEDRVFVATTGGVVAVALHDGAAGTLLDIDEGFQGAKLRGPLVALGEAGLR